MFNFLIQFPLTRWLWSLLPSRCSHPGCEDLYLRWTEHRVEALNRKREVLYWDYICDACVHKMRQEAFKNNWSTTRLDESRLLFRHPDLESEGPEPLEE